METKQENVLILLAHPNMSESKANKAMIGAVKDLANVKVIDLYAEAFDVNYYSKAIAEAKAVVFQFPFYWASAPSQLKKWLDEVFIALAGSDIVKGKPLLIATTAASEYEAYRSGGRNNFTMDELLRPYQLTANHSGMVWQTPYIVYGLGQSNSEDIIREGAAGYKALIEKLM